MEVVKNFGVRNCDNGSINPSKHVRPVTAALNILDSRSSASIRLARFASDTATAKALNELPASACVSGTRIMIWDVRSIRRA